MTSIQCLSTDNKPITIWIDGENITGIQEGFVGDGAIDLRDQIVLPQLIDGHNHPVPYNFGDGDKLLGSHAKDLWGTFSSRGQWRPLAKDYEDGLRATKDLLKKDNAKACQMHQYAAYLDVGASVIQGFKAYFEGACDNNAGIPLQDARNGVAEVTVFFEPGDTLEDVRQKRTKDLDRISEAELPIVHVAEGMPGDPDIQQETFLAYFTNVMHRAGSVIIHGNGLTEGDLKYLKGQEIGGVIWSPTSQARLYSEAGVFNARRALELGLNVGLGPDWSMTGSANILREIASAQVFLEKEGYAPEEAAKLALKMVSENNAMIFGLEQYNGIRPGNIASLTFVPKDEIWVNGALNFDGLDEADVTLQFVRGQATFGDTNVLQALHSDAEPLSLSEACRAAGVDKAVVYPDGTFSGLESFIKQNFPDAPDIVQCE